jgi:hypothetical protein
MSHQRRRAPRRLPAHPPHLPLGRKRPTLEAGRRRQRARQGKAKVISQEIVREMTQEITEEMVCWMYCQHQVHQDLPDRNLPATQKRATRKDMTK